MNYKIKFLAISIGISTGSIATQAMALPITVNVSSYAYTSDSAPDSDSGTSVSSTSQYFGSNPVTGHWASNYATAKADNTGISYVNVHTGQASGNAIASVQQSAMIYNNTSSTQNVSFNFLIEQGSLHTETDRYMSSSLLQGNESASYNAEILLNGVSIWSSSATLGYDTSGWTFSQSGTDLNGQFLANDWGHGPSYRWNDFSGLLNLGPLTAGDSFTLDYIMSVTSNTFNADELDSAYGAFADFGDPWHINAIDESNILSSPATTSVPEPAGAALLGLGLLGLAYSRKSKKAV